MKRPPKLSYHRFYKSIKEEFSRIAQLTIWKDYNWKEEPAYHSIIITKIALEMISWAKDDNYEDIERLLEIVESAFLNASHGVVSYIGTDFTVTILETEEKMVRERIKSLMGPRTASCYKLNLNGYREPN